MTDRRRGDEELIRGLREVLAWCGPMETTKGIRWRERVQSHFYRPSSTQTARSYCSERFFRYRQSFSHDRCNPFLHHKIGLGCAAVGGGLIPDASIEISVEAKAAMPPRKVAAAETCATAAKLPREEAGSSISRLQYSYVMLLRLAFMDLGVG